MSWITLLKNPFLHYFVLSKIPNQECRDHLYEMVRHLLQGDIWALRMFDSTAKLPVGLGTGNLVNYGNMYECLEVDVKENFGSFTGKHCIVELYAPSALSGSIAGTIILYKWGVCIPSTCSANDLQEFLTNTLFLPAIVHSENCHILNESRPYQAGELFIIFILVVLTLLACLSTMYDYWGRSEKKNQLLLSFSVRTNLRNLFDTSTAKQSLDFLVGMRFIAAVVVVLGHVYFAAAVYGVDINRTRYLEWLSSWSHVWLTSRGVMVDSFFVFGGMLCSYQLVKEQAKGKKLNLKLYYIHRYLRITPVLVFMMMFMGTLSVRLGTGPIWQGVMKHVANDCATNWWQNMLFINNWWGNEMCLEQTWYLAVDMQLYCLAPLLLIPLQNRPRFGLILTYAVLFAFILISFLVSFILEEKVDMFRNAASLQERILYESTFNRAIPWLSGFLLGYYMGKYKHMAGSSDDRSRRKKPINWCKFLLATLTWIIILGLAVGIMLAVHPFMQPNYHYKAFESACYLVFSHVTWTLCTVFAIIACAIGYGGPFNLFFSWKCFIPLSRLSYCIFMLHVLIVKLSIIDAKTTTYLSDFNLFMITISVTFFTILGSIVLYLLVERPVAILEQILLYGNKEVVNTRNKSILRKNRKGTKTSEEEKPLLPL